MIWCRESAVKKRLITPERHSLGNLAFRSKNFSQPNTLNGVWNTLYLWQRALPDFTPDKLPAYDTGLKGEEDENGKFQMFIGGKPAYFEDCPTRLKIGKGAWDLLSSLGGEYGHRSMPR